MYQTYLNEILKPGIMIMKKLHTVSLSISSFARDLLFAFLFFISENGPKLFSRPSRRTSWIIFDQTLHHHHHLVHFNFLVKVCCRMGQVGQLYFNSDRINRDTCRNYLINFHFENETKDSWNGKIFTGSPNGCTETVKCKVQLFTVKRLVVNLRKE